tara:strand:- start:40911 stop:41519 length:609 start_codon:yes stop_codon:yes gene_type:complete
MLLANNLSFSRNDKNIFADINLSLTEGQITQVRGKNGSGKTTFLKVILNILETNTGEIFWRGKNIKKNIFNLYNETTFILDQKTSTRQLTVLDNINFWRGLSSSKLNIDKIFLLLETFNILKYKNTKVMNLSSGEIQKLELIRLIMEQKKLWVLDEPYNNLDGLSAEILTQTFLDHSNKNGIVLFTSHFSPQISKMEIIDIK